MLDFDNLQDALLARDRAPKIQVRRKLIHVPDAIRQKLVEFSGRDDESSTR